MKTVARDRDRDRDFNFSDERLDELLNRIYTGEVNPLNLPEDLYQAIAKHLLGGVKEGFGEPGSISIEWGLKDEKLIAALEENIYMFSGAKTFQQTVEMSDALVDGNGELRGFDDFKKAANEIYVRYNGGYIDDEVKPGWIEAEYNTAVIQANNAKKWNDIEKQKKVLPYLVYNALDNACDICSHFNGICLPVDHPFWDQYMPENHFNCLCIVEQVEREEGEGDESDDSDIEEAITNADVPDDFKYNPGKKGEIFSSEGKSAHPYFSVPKEYAKFAEENFNLPIPE